MTKKKLRGAVKVSELVRSDSSRTGRSHSQTFWAQNLVDLAGSESLTEKYGAAQQRETKHINLSLSQLKTVIQALSKKEQYVADMP